MRGAIVFIVVFILGLLLTLSYQDLPPGRQIYDALNLPTPDYEVLGIQVTTLVIAVFNGVIYGVIVWLIYSLAERARKRKPKAPQQSR
jgi:ABC-type Fe3+ transport system permease subunit